MLSSIVENGKNEYNKCIVSRTISYTHSSKFVNEFILEAIKKGNYRPVSILLTVHPESSPLVSKLLFLYKKTISTWKDYIEYSSIEEIPNMLGVLANRKRCYMNHLKCIVLLFSSDKVHYKVYFFLVHYFLRHYEKIEDLIDLPYNYYFHNYLRLLLPSMRVEKSVIRKIEEKCDIFTFSELLL